MVLTTATAVCFRPQIGVISENEQRIKEENQFAQSFRPQIGVISENCKDKLIGSTIHVFPSPNWGYLWNNEYNENREKGGVSVPKLGLSLKNKMSLGDYGISVNGFRPQIGVISENG